MWLAARVLVLTPYAWASLVANVAFPAAAALGLAIPLRKAGNRRNYFFVGLLLLMAAGSAIVHLDTLGLVSLPGWAGLSIALDVVLFILCVMGGRVIPMFTNNGVPGARATRQPRVEQAALGLVILLALGDAAQWPPGLLAVVAGAAGIAHAWRWWLWQPWKTLRTPLVWVLHAAYAWIPLHLALRSLAAVGVASPSLATHALTTGAVSGLVIGMMCRTSRGHTARRLQPDRFEVACFALVLLAGVVRVGVPLASPAHLMAAVQGSALLWSAGFGLFAVRYWPVWTRPRLDGQPG